jgi:serine phosphatase RsbU (regulator of sigma subunit)
LAQADGQEWEFERICDFASLQSCDLDVACVVAEYRLPDADGFTLLGHLALSFHPHPTPPFIFLTHENDAAPAVQALKLGADDYLIKGQTSPEQVYHSVLAALLEEESRRETKQRRQALRKKNEALQEQKAQLQEALHTIEADHARKTRELEEARALQIAMLPSEPVVHSCIDVQAYMHTAHEVGGDYYDFLQLGPDHWRLVIGDATGHALKSGIVVATAKSHFQLMGDQLPSLDLLENISEGIRSLNLRHMYMGMTLLDVKGREVVIHATGMPPIYHYRAAHRSVDVIRQTGMYLGGRLPINQTCQSVQLQPGDRLLASTDGLTELIDRHHAEGSAHLITGTLQEQHGLSASALLHHFIAMGKKWVHEQARIDDLSLLLLGG